jgi:protein SCO1/2
LRIRRTLLASMLCLALVAACDRDDHVAPFASTDVTGADFGSDFSLTDPSGQTRRLADFRGKVVAMFFGYTQCPDICPTTLNTLAQTMKLLGDDAKNVQVLFITLDPERDTPKLLAQYVPSFYPTFLGLYGDSQAIAKTAQTFKVFYQKQPGSKADVYTIDHSAGTYVFDPKGRLRLYVGQADKPANIAADFKRLLAGQ